MPQKRIADLWTSFRDFTEEQDEHTVGRPLFSRCTPEKLLAYMLKIGHIPSLAECKKQFGGILGPMFDGWELQRSGRWPSHLEGKGRRT